MRRSPEIIDELKARAREGSGNAARELALQQLYDDDPSEWAAAIGQSVVSHNPSVLNDQKRSVQRGLAEYAATLRRSIETIDGLQGRWTQIFEGVTGSFRKTRMSLTSEARMVVSDLRDVLGEMNEVLERLGDLERLADVCERLKQLSSDGWLEGLLLGLLNRTEESDDHHDEEDKGTRP